MAKPVVDEQNYRDSLRAAMLQPSLLLNTSSGNDAIVATLKMIGEMLAVDRVLVLENVVHGSAARVALCHVWQSPNVP
jgi:hypothetical protein